MSTRKTLKALFAAVAALSLSAAVPAGAAPTVVNGSGILTTIVVGAPGTLTFDYDLFTGNKNEPSGTQDFAYYTINGTAFLLATQNSAAANSSDPGNPSSGFSTFTVAAPVGAGSVTIGFGVVNVGNAADFTALLLDRVRIGGTLIPNGSFENFPDFQNFSTVGNTTVQLAIGAATPTDGIAQALLANSTQATTGGPADPTTDINSLAAGTGTTALQLNTIAAAVNPAAAVPLPTGVVVAPLGLAVAGMFVLRARRAAVLA